MRRIPLFVVALVTSSVLYGSVLVSIDGDSSITLLPEETNVARTNHNASKVFAYTDGNDNMTFAFRNVPRKSSNLMPRKFSCDEYDEAMDFFLRLKHFFCKQNITWVLSYGTLLGSYFMHDILPWDDDLDIWIYADDIQRIQALNNSGVLSRQGIGYINEDFRMHKFFKMSNPFFKRKRWSFPYVDIKLYQLNNTHAWNIDKRKRRHEIIVPRKCFLPLQMRPLGGMWFPAPRDTWLILHKVYGTITCKTGRWDHTKEHSLTQRHQASCAKINGVYPMVYRLKLGNGTLENLVLKSNITLLSVYLNQPYHDNQYVSGFSENFME